jgi:hypothetical protein
MERKAIFCCQKLNFDPSSSSSSSLLNINKKEMREKKFCFEKIKSVKQHFGAEILTKEEGNILQFSKKDNAMINKTILNFVRSTDLAANQEKMKLKVAIVNLELQSEKTYIDNEFNIRI